jgi:hypothetical protein
MVFKNPVFLYLIPLSLIPILLHLLFIKFLKAFPFPYLGFLERKEDIRKRRRRIKEILLLLSRILFLLSFLLFLSSPFLKKEIFPDILVKDVSESTLLYRDLIEEKFNKVSKIIDRIFYENFLETSNKKGNVFVITDGDKNFFKKIKESEENFFIFIPYEKRDDIGIYDLKITDKEIVVKIYSTKEVSDASLKIIFDENSFSFSFKIYEGLNEYFFPLKVKDFEFLKLQVLPLDFLPENNFYFLSKPKFKKLYKIFGNPSKYLENLLSLLGYKKIDEISDSVLFIFYGIPHEKETLQVLLNFINYEKPCLLFIDSEDFFKTSLKKDLNLKIDDEIVYFSKVFDIKEGKAILNYKGINYVSILKNTILFGFLPEPSYTEIVYSPSFLKIFKIGIEKLKFNLPYSLNFKKDTFIYFPGEYRVYDSGKNLVLKGYDKISFKNLNYGSYFVKNNKKFYLNLNFSKDEFLIEKIEEREIKDLLKNSKIYSLNEIEKFLPVSLKNFFLSLSFLFLLMEIFFIILL